MSEQDRSKCPWCGATAKDGDYRVTEYRCESRWWHCDPKPCGMFRSDSCWRAENATLTARVAELEGERDKMETCMEIEVASNTALRTALAAAEKERGRLDTCIGELYEIIKKRNVTIVELEADRDKRWKLAAELEEDLAAAEKRAGEAEKALTKFVAWHDATGNDDQPDPPQSVYDDAIEAARQALTQGADHEQA